MFSLREVPHCQTENRDEAEFYRECGQSLQKEALERLDFAINESREMKMQPSLERALRHKDILKA
jgi:hypothetical protein